MRQQARLDQILATISSQDRISVEQIADLSGTSLATARRDLSVLTARGLVTRTHGGAVAVASGYELPMAYRLARNAPAKRAIGAAAAALVAAGDVVGLTGGTTTSELGRALAARPDLVPRVGTGVTVMTNALNIAYELAIRPHVKLVMTGGVARPQTFELVGPIAADTLSDVVIDIAFIGVDGLDASRGATTTDEAEADVNHRMLGAARRVVVVADATKFDHAAFARTCTLTEIHTLVTDAAPPERLAEALANADVEVIVSPPQSRG
ncbi:DeoR/GlpR transcriptional regulator [Occultella glacieicola]|uniref:DeoR/GlpR transcriptional regulator n=1 Tax=Occultella glacieicola TaxID=2518684 RepID=A0ABY2E8Q3_9MICO|nr:DeoR/GlpR family DNA-binding transcription regulator [Occultella glacieicola]TDE95097.1 DeoR/GlpR transcriptional regulator [Occultella glacieicola]